MKRVLLVLMQLFITGPIFIILTIVISFITIVGSWIFGNRYFVDYPGRVWGWITCLISMHKVSVFGRSNIYPDSSYVFVANHQGAFDIFLIYGYLHHPFRWIMKHQLRNIPILGMACRVTGQIFVNHNNPSSIKQTLRRAKNYLEGGTSILIFPEGARTKSGLMGNFRRGGFQVAVELGLPIVPLTIDGAYEAMPRGEYKLTPTHLKLTIHPPIITKGMSQEHILALISEVKQTIASSLPEHRR
ncbi:MAG: lysophospholipid acyltransferase family protein [Bacteroidales bacterium]